jgi:hypothetical protein
VTALAFRWQLGRWNGFLDYDGHFHLRMAQWIAHLGGWADIPWLPYTVLGERGPDHEWLWHVTLVPYTWLSDANEGLAWGAAINGALVPATLSFVMRMLGIPAAPLFALLAVTAGTLMPYRLMMLRAQNAAIIFMVLALWAMAKQRYRLLALVAFAFMESYHAAVVMVPIAFLGCAVQSAAEKRLALAPLAAVAAGLALGLLVSPWAPRNLEFLFFHVLYKTQLPLHGEQISSLISTEWYPPPLQTLLLQSWPAHLLLAGATTALAVRAWRTREFPGGRDTVLAVCIAFLSLALYAKAVRFAEYYVPFCALAAGLAARDLWRPSVRHARAQMAAAAAAALLGASVGVTALGRIAIADPDHLAEVGRALNERGRPGEMVFNSSWVDFTALVWWADSFRYVNGLDGHFLAFRDPARFVVWQSLIENTVAGDPASLMRVAFGARFAVIAPQHAALARRLQESPAAVLRVASPDGWLFEIRER